MFKVEANFYNNYKLGDNVNYNLRVLRVLYRAMNDSGSPDLFYKPITILNISIIESILADFFMRIHTNHYEGVSSIGDAVWGTIRGTKVDCLHKYIEHAEKHDLFGADGSNFYETLFKLKAVRNRIHIQDLERHKQAQKDLNKSESQVFARRRIKSSEKCLEYLLWTMSTKHKRKSGLSDKHVSDHNVPWDQYFKLDGTSSIVEVAN